jgi:hypothetical protein
VKGVLFKPWFIARGHQRRRDLWIRSKGSSREPESCFNSSKEEQSRDREVSGPCRGRGRASASKKNHHEYSEKLVTKPSMEILGKEPTITTIIMVFEAPRYALDVFKMTFHTHNTVLKVISKKNIKL